MMRRNALLLGAALGLAGAGPALAVDIGLLTPLTGTNTSAGTDMANGVALALKRINAGYEVPLNDGSTRKLGPGIKGSPLNIIVEDTESRPAAAMDAVRKLVTADHVPLVLGEFSSGISLPTGQFSNENRAIQISIASTSPKLRDIGKYFFNAIGLDIGMGTELGKFAHEDGHVTRVASIVPNNPFGVGIEIHSCESLHGSGGACVTTVRYELERPDYRAEIRALTNDKPDAVFFTAYGTEARLILRQMYELGGFEKLPIYSAFMSNWTNEVAETPQIAEGIRGLDVGASGEFYDTQYAKPYEAKFGRPPLTSFGTYGYDATMLAALALSEADPTDPDAIAAALHKAGEIYKGASGNKEFDQDGMQVSESYRQLIYKNGELKPYP